MSPLFRHYGYLLYKAESLCVCMLFMHSVTAGAFRTRPGAGPPHIPGHVLGYPDPGNTGPRGYSPYCGGEGILVGRGPLASRWGGGGEWDGGMFMNHRNLSNEPQISKEWIYKNINKPDSRTLHHLNFIILIRQYITLNLSVKQNIKLLKYIH